jgi:hypothetical protein
MNCVVIGAKDRNTPEDRVLVDELLDKLSDMYPNAIFVTMLTHTGVGRFVKEKCLQKYPDGRFRFQLIACDFRLYAVGLSQSELAQIYLARNASPFELGDCFCYFASQNRKGTMEALVERAQKSGRPFRVFLPSEKITLPIF